MSHFDVNDVVMALVGIETELARANKLKAIEILAEHGASVPSPENYAFVHKIAKEGVA